jgi:hypothetical protein
LKINFFFKIAKNSMTLSITSREDVYSISEIEVFASTWPPSGVTISKKTDTNEPDIVTNGSKTFEGMAALLEPSGAASVTQSELSTATTTICEFSKAIVCIN